MRHTLPTIARSRLATLLLAALLGASPGALLGASSAVVAQDAPEEDEAPPAAPAPQQPVYRGRDRATGQASNALGATYELGNGAKLVLPAGNRISSSQTFTFSVSRAAPRPSEVAAGFVRQGPVLAFDGQIDASRAPVELSLKQRGLRMRPGMKVVLAMEIAGICDATHTTRLGGPLCSHWRLLDAQLDMAAGRIVAQIPSPGGRHLVFGFVPDAQAAPVDPANLP
jgi:hypothetical protein